MRVLHLNTYASGGSYEYAAVFCKEQTHACRLSYWRMPELSRVDLACLIQSKQGKWRSH
jgi:hypothetical protein